MKPKYINLKESLIAQIRINAFPMDEPILSEAELSIKYQVSRNTVRQALKELETEGYLYRKQGKGTFIRRITSLNSHKIALLIYDSADMQHSVTMEMITGLSEVLEQNNFLLDVLASQRTFQEENISQLARNYAGFVVGSFRLDEFTLAELGKLAIPYIFVKNYLPDRHDLSVRIDFNQAGFLAAAHLIECGCRSLALIYPGRQLPISADFFDGVCSAALGSGVRIKKEHIFSTGSYVCNEVALVAEALASDIERPDGIVAASDATAGMLLDIFSQKGIRVPEQIMITGCNDTSGLAKMTNPPLTTVRLPMREAGRITAEKIISMIKGEKTESVMLTPELVIRRSTEERK